MVNRAERRRIKKVKTMVAKQEATLTPEDRTLKAAEAELDAGLSETEVGKLDSYAARLVIWQQHESQRILAKEWYELTSELKGEKQRWVQAYVEAKKALVVAHRRLCEVLEQMDAEDIELALTRTFTLPGGINVRCPRRLAEELRFYLDGAHKQEASAEQSQEVSG